MENSTINHHDLRQLRFIISLFAGENYLKQNVNLISADFGEQQMLRISFTRENSAEIQHPLNANKTCHAH